MEYSMYVCPECRKVFKVKGNDKRVKCNKCGDIYLSDMHMEIDQWQALERSDRDRHISAFLATKVQVNTQKAASIPSEVGESGQKRRSFFQESTSPNHGGLRNYKCPNCNAALMVNESSSQATCSYCGVSFHIDDGSQRIKYEFENSHQAGFDFERGRLEAQNLGVSDEFLSKLRNAIEIAKRKEALAQNIAQLQDQLSKHERKQKELESFTSTATPYLIACGIAAVMLFYMLVGSAHIVIRILLFLAGLAGAYFAMKYSQNRLYAQREDIENKIDDVNGEISRNTYEMNGLDESEGLELIPLKYRTVEALECIVEFLMNKRALNIQQAINLYEDKKHHDEIERMHREQIELQRQEIEDLKRMNMQNKQNSGSGLGTALQAGAAAAFTISVLKDIKDDLF